MNNHNTPNKTLFKRLLHSHHDLIHARSRAGQILNRSLHEEPQGSNEHELLKCLNTALVVSYWCPFSGNRGSEDVNNALPDSYMCGFTREEKDLHRLIGKYRNTDHAHSDPKSRSIQVVVERGCEGPVATPSGRDPFVPLSTENVKQLVEMIEKLLQKIVTEQKCIESQMTVGDQF